MDALDPLSQVAGGNASSPLLLIMGCIGAFFAGALITSLVRGKQEQGWFKGKEKDDEWALLLFKNPFYPFHSFHVQVSAKPLLLIGSKGKEGK